MELKEKLKEKRVNLHLIKEEELENTLEAIIPPDSRVAVHKESLGISLKLNRETLYTPLPKETLTKATHGITGASSIIAATGTIVLSETDGYGRILSNMPETHIVIASTQAIVPDMAAALKEIRQTDFPPYISFTTGPSRTADIAGKIVHGMHGPRKVELILIEYRQ